MRLALFHILLFIVGLIKAQQTTISAVLDRDSILIGEQIKLTLSTASTSNNNIEFPEINDTISRDIEVVEKGKLHKSKTDGVFKQNQELLITAFDSGMFIIPPFKFFINDDSSYTKQLSVYVNTIQIDTALGYKPINDILSIPEPKRPFEYKNLLWLLLLLPVIIGIVLYFYFKNKPTQEKVVEIIVKPAHETAFASLEQLEGQKLWQSGKVKGYHSELSIIVRQYLSDRYNVNALEQTSGELITTIKNSNLTTQLQLEKIQQVLTLADNVKFAKYMPIEQEHNFSLENVKAFIQETQLKSE